MQPFPWTDFAGLDLRSEGDEAGCLDLVNVQLDRPTSIRTRMGSKLFATPPVTSTSVERIKPFYRTSGDQLLAHYKTSSGSSVTAFNAGGGVVASQAMTGSSSVCDFASSGTPAAERAYVCDSAGLMYRWSGSTFTQVSGSPQCSYIAPTVDGRLLAANISTLPSGSGAASASSSLVHLSDPGDPETWSANNYEYLTPGDGDAITAVVSWQNLTFVFKRTKYFVFTTPAEDGSGNPIFDYRTIDTRISAQTKFSAVAAPEGVYFVSGDGIYLTDGFAPRKVSTPLDPFFTGDTSDYWTGSTLNTDVWGGGGDPTDTWGDGTGTDTWGDGGIADLRLAYANGTLYCFLYGHTGMFVYDVRNQKFGYWTLPLAGYSLTALQIGTAGEELLTVGQTTKVVRMDRSRTTDSGAGITAHWRSPFIHPTMVRQRGNLAVIPDQEATIQESELTGTGCAGFSVARDWATSLPTSGGGAKALVKMGATVPTRGFHTIDQAGAAMSFQIETPTASDDFSSNTIANYTADVGATTNVTITGGVMDASANLTTQNALILTSGTFTDFGDCVLQAKHTLGTTLALYQAGVIFKRVAADSALRVAIGDSGSASALTIEKRVGGVQTILASSAITRLTVSTAYWVGVRIEGNVITAEHFTSNPATTAAATTATYTLTGADATTYGSGIVGKTGLLIVPQQTAASLDDFSVVGGAWGVQDLTMHLNGFRPIGVKTS